MDYVQNILLAYNPFRICVKYISYNELNPKLQPFGCDSWNIWLIIIFNMEFICSYDNKHELTFWSVWAKKTLSSVCKLKYINNKSSTDVTKLSSNLSPTRYEIVENLKSQNRPGFWFTSSVARRPGMAGTVLESTSLSRPKGRAIPWHINVPE